MENSILDLRFYFITDDGILDLPAKRQVEIAVAAGATAVQYRNKGFSVANMPEVIAIRDFCALHRVLFLVNDDIVLARAAGADGVHLGQADAAPALAREILGDAAIVGISVSTPAELAQTDLSACDYIGTGPVAHTGTKADAKAVIGTGGIADMVCRVSLPVVAIGGITPELAGKCFAGGAAGAAVISAITRASDPADAAGRFGAACGVSPGKPRSAWQDEFSLIRRILADSRVPEQCVADIEVAGGDDAALFKAIDRPVFTTDAQREGIHFRRRWQSMSDIGAKAVEITFSDLAASYAVPAALFVNLALPSDIAEDDVMDLYAGIRKALARHDAVLGGGNISGARVLGVDLFAVGRGHPELFPLRSAAVPGWGLYVTGPLGLARAGLDCLGRGESRFPGLIRAFTRPRARFDAAEVLAACGVTCVMDISDGLAGDAAHIAEDSGVSVELDLSTVSAAPELAEFCKAFGRSPANMMAAGGEDYELLFACAPEVFTAVAEKLPGAFQVGVCREFTGESICGLPEGIRGYRHGQRSGYGGEGK